MRLINEIVLHCTATRPEWWAGRSLADQVAEVRRWHVQERGWKDIGYHYLIGRDGTVLPGRPVEQVGAHVAGRNANTIGVALFGGHGSAVTDPFARNFAPEQDRALRALLADLRRRFPTIRLVTGHNQYAAKACPGFDVPTWLDAAPAPIAPPARPPVPPAGSTGILAALLSLFRKR